MTSYKPFDFQNRAASVARELTSAASKFPLTGKLGPAMADFARTVHFEDTPLESQKMLNDIDGLKGNEDNKTNDDDSDDKMILEVEVHMLTRRNGAEYAQGRDRTCDLGSMFTRIVAEMMAGDLRVDYDMANHRFVIYRHNQNDYVTNEEGQVPGWHPVRTLTSEYGQTKTDRTAYVPIDGLVAYTLFKAGLFIGRGMRFQCRDGAIISWCVPEKGAAPAWWGIALVGDDGDTRLSLSEHAPADVVDRAKTDPRSIVPDLPMTFETRTGVDITTAIRYAADAEALFRRWTGGRKGGDDNLLNGIAAMFLRDHPEWAIVLQGLRGSGKSTIARALFDALGQQSVMFSLALLEHPTAMSAENAMGDLCTHLFALTDDYSPKHGALARIEGPFKTLITGLPPFSSRRQGENATHGIPQAMHMITTNDPLRTGNDGAMTRRIRYAIVTDDSRHSNRKEFLKQMDQAGGFWPFLLAGAINWVRTEGSESEAMKSVQPVYGIDDLDDATVEIVSAMLESDNDWISNQSANGYRGWSSIGAVKDRKTIDGKRTWGHRPPRKGEDGWPLWMAAVNAIRTLDSISEKVRESADRIAFTAIDGTDLPAKNLTLTTFSELMEKEIGDAPSGDQ